MNHRLVLPSLVMLIGFGCAKTDFAPVGGTAGESGPPSRKLHASCELTNYDYLFNAQVVEFSVTGAKGAHFGFGAGVVKWLAAFDARFNLQSSTLTVATDLFDFRAPEEPLASATGDGTQKEGRGGLEVDIYSFKLGGNLFYRTAMYKAMVQALRNSVQNAANKIKGQEGDWHTVVAAIATTDRFIVPVGSLAGLKVGDQFDVYNVGWSGEPCKSDPFRSPDIPIAVLQVVDSKDLSPNKALLKVVQRTDGSEIEPGAFVYPKNLGTRVLKRSLVLQDIKPFEITVKSPSGSEEKLDLTVFLNTAIKEVVGDYGFYIRKPSTGLEIE